MKVTLNVQNKHFFALAFMLAIILFVGLVMAPAPNPGHSYAQLDLTNSIRFIQYDR